jgi:predicted metal-binding membrane protein
MLAHGWQRAGHGFHHLRGLAQELPDWMGMVAAMMLPFSLDALRLTAVRSLWSRRHRAIIGFLIGYFAAWIAAGTAAVSLRGFVLAHTYAAASLSFVAGALWQRTRLHRRALAECHSTRPLTPTGWRADRDCVRFGGIIGAACVQSCWPVMLGCLFTGHSLTAMAAGTAISVAERWTFRPRTRVILSAPLVLAAYYAILAAKQ